MNTDDRTFQFGRQYRAPFTPSAYVHIDDSDYYPLPEETMDTDDKVAQVAEAARDRDTEAAHGGDELINCQAFADNWIDWLDPKTDIAKRELMTDLQAALDWEPRIRHPGAGRFTYECYTRRLADLGERILQIAMNNGLRDGMLDIDE